MQKSRIGMRNEIGIYQIDRMEYPSKQNIFRPHKIYKEFGKLPIAECAEETNDVYEGIRNVLMLLEYDRKNIGTDRWNPLRDFILPGQYVVIKPNLVMHKNKSGQGEACLYTHPSVVAAVLDYTILAMTDESGKFDGKIVIGDAPMQSCDFDRLLNESGYSLLTDYYKKKGYAVEVKDFRNIKVVDCGWISKKREKDSENGIIVSLGSKSNFAELSAERMKRLRITSYDPSVMKRHHNMKKHEYRIAQEILEADVVINIPKPKTHRKAGITIAMKNFVGINANKEYLPHHTVGSRLSGAGDEYLHTNVFFRMAGFFEDWKNAAMQREYYKLAGLIRLFAGIYNMLGRKIAKDPYREGSWYGNDTIWRTIYDLNNIIFYCDKSGRIRNHMQRKVLNIADMVIAGENDGPLAPSPRKCGILVAGENPALFDECVCSLMGIAGKKIPSISHLRDTDRLFFTVGHARVLSNISKWDTGKKLISFEDSFQFIPNPGWRN